MKKNKKFLSFLLLSLFTVIMLLACKPLVSLGTTVDVLPPEGKIIYPMAGETPIRGSFIIKGTAFDDEGVKNVSVVFENKDSGNKERKGPFNGTLTSAGGGNVSWTISIPNESIGEESGHPLVKIYPIPDGEYEAIITLTDKNGKTTLLNQTYKIDNTPPVFIVSRPSTIAGVDENPNTYDRYGAIFSVIGQVGEKNTVEKLNVLIPGANVNVSKMFIGKNVNVQMGVYKGPNTDPLYTFQAGNMSKAVKAQMFLYDNAREFNGGESLNEGNKAEWYYLRDSIYLDVLEKGYTAEVIADYLAGKKGNDSDDHNKNIKKLRSDTNALSILASAMIKMNEKRSSFKLDPSKSPGFKVLGVRNLPKNDLKDVDNPGGTLDIDNASSILFNNNSETSFIVELLRNRDKTPLVEGNTLDDYKKSDIEIVLFKWDGTGDKAKSFKTGENLIPLPPLVKFSDLNNTNSITMEGESLRVKCTLPSPFVEETYLLKVKGRDISKADSNTFAAYDDSNSINDGLYLIKFMYAGAGVKVKANRINGYHNKKVKIEADVSGLDAGGVVYYNIGSQAFESSPDPLKILEKEDPGNPSSGKYFKEIDISDETAYPDGEYKVYIFAQNGGVNQNQKDLDETSFEVDRNAPELEETSPNLATNISGDFLMVGRITDEKIGVKSVKYIKGKQLNVPTVDTPDASWADVEVESGTWKIDFSGTNNITAIGNIAQLGTVVPDSGDKLYDVPIYFLVKDKLDNAAVITKTVRVDPYGDIPEVTILSPAADSVLGGTIRIAGTVSVPKPDIGMVGSMQIQITNKTTGNPDEPDFNQSVFFGSEDWCPPEGKDITYTSGSPYWSIEINKNHEFESSSVDDQVIWFRLRGKNNKTPAVAGQWTQPVKIIVNKKAPTITGVKVSTAANINTPVPGGSVFDPDNRAYVSNMWIKGDDLYLCADLAHSAGIEKIDISGSYVGSSTITLSGDSQITGTNINETHEAWFEQSSVPSSTPAKNYKMRIPLKTTGNPGANNGFNIKIVITAKKTGSDVQELTAQSSWELKYDNTAPFAVFGTKIYSSGSFKITGQEFTDNALIGKTNIKESMRVLSSGQSKKITAFDSTTGKITLESAFSDPTTGYLIYAPIDYLRPSGGKVGVFGAAYDVGAGVEKLKVEYKINGTSSDSPILEFPLGIQKDVGVGDIGFVTWTGELNTNALIDGKGTLTITPIDAAGNTPSSPIEVEVKHKKDSLTITGVQLGTDLNRNGNIEGSPLFETKDLLIGYGTLNASGGIDTTHYDWHGNSDAGTFRFKNNKSQIKVATTGGSGIKKYTLKRKKIDDSSLEVEVHSLRPLPANGIIELSQTDFDKIKQSANFDTDPTKRTLVLTVWDSAHGLTCGTDTWKAELELDVIVDTVDRVPPTNEIEPFKWVSEDENSLYENKRSNGHIEIGTDLTNSFTVGGTGIMDRDDKVSGKISITGTAHDDQVITEIWAKIDGFTFTGAAGAGSGTDTKLATYNASNGDFMVESGNFGTSGWKFTIVSNDFSVENGHTVKWQLDWDSSKITGGVGTDKTITVTAKDTNQTNSASDNRKVDVVPYITNITTKLSELSSNASVYNRTALGRYPVSDKEEITIEGFNLGGAEFKLNGVKLDPSGTKYKIGSAKSGELIATVGTIESINNKNDNTKPYNQEPNKVNNDLLTDDRFIDVWEFKQAAKPANGFISYPVLKVSPKDGSVGLAYANGVTYFNMAGFKNDAGQSDYKSARQFDKNWAQYVHTDFVFDEHGYTYGMATGVDMNTSVKVASYSKFVSRRPGIMSDYNNMGNNDATGTQNGIGLRLENIGTTSNPYTVDPDRIQSPSITTVAGNASTEETFIYLAYYDTINQHIRYRWGKVAKDSASPYHKYDGQLIDLKGYGKMQEPPATSFSILAGPPAKAYPSDNGGSTQTDDVNNSGKYVSLAAVKASLHSTDHDVVTAVWYNFKERSLMYSYAGGAETPRKDNVTWSAPVKISSGGEYVRSVADSDGGIHVAFYDSGNLKYAYLPKYDKPQKDWSVVIVDSYSLTGTHVSIDLARAKAGGKWIPYISYYMQGGASAKLAYLVDETAPEGTGAGSIKAGAGTDEKFTGEWEVSIVPATNVIREYRINVGVWKDTTGVIKAIPYKADSGSDGVGWVTGGNDTANPILGYAVVEDGAFETAQKK